MNKLTLFLIISVLAHIIFASEYRSIGARTFLVLDHYFVEEVTPEGSRIMEGWVNMPNIPNNPVQEYFVYGLTNVIAGKNYMVPFYSTITNDFLYGHNGKCPALVMIPPAEISSLSEEAAAIATNNTAEQQAYVQTLQRAKMTAAAERNFHYISAQATNGSPMNQYALGQMYLKGEYPAPMNSELGFYWIEKAATNNNPDAKAYLKSLMPVPAKGT